MKVPQANKIILFAENKGILAKPYPKISGRTGIEVVSVMEMERWIDLKAVFFKQYRHWQRFVKIEESAENFWTTRMYL